MPSLDCVIELPGSADSGNGETRCVSSHLPRNRLPRSLGTSARAVDRLIRAHGLASGAARQVLEAQEDYGENLVRRCRSSTCDASHVTLSVRAHSWLPPMDYAPGRDIRSVGLSSTTTLVSGDYSKETPALKRWRVEVVGPTFMGIGRLIRYSSIHVDVWSGEQAMR